ncbi:uncharacterized protein K441DRAFT_658088, partial [Cenococcum geophilum 1.58]|uniref:uncharacterized protein n=1 Tax=Cenococcum geophilum 1.58 TaxID=794803 RepID=UPI00358E9F34
MPFYAYGVDIEAAGCGHVTAPRFNLMACILLLYEHKHEHGSWYLTTILPTCTHCPT